MSGRWILVTISPRAARKIIYGRKRVEIRRRRLKRICTHLVLYVGRPEKLVIGYAQIRDVDEARPETLWARYGLKTGMELGEYNYYLREAPLAVGIVFGRVQLFDQPMGLEEIGVRPPQGVQYLSDEQVSIITGRMGDDGQRMGQSD